MLISIDHGTNKLRLSIMHRSHLVWSPAERSLSMEKPCNIREHIMLCPISGFHTAVTKPMMIGSSS